MQRAAAPIPATADPAEKQRSFTGSKLDWMTALSADPRIDARAFEVGFQIAQHVNMQTGVAFISDDTIGDKTGIPRRWVLRARSDLRDAHWINWKRTRTANLYWTLGDNINCVTDHQIMLRDARAERRTKAKLSHQVAPRVAHLRTAEAPPTAQRVAPRVADQDVPRVANVHLSGNTSVETPED
jgi:hypothetical protein